MQEVLLSALLNHYYLADPTSELLQDSLFKASS
jgi:hypothetical protein